MRTAAAAVATLALAGCSHAGASSAAPDPAQLLDRGVASLDQRDYEGASGHLEAVLARCRQAPAARRAALLLAAAHLDPRNPRRDPQRAAALSAAYLRGGGAPAWSAPLARVLYLQALEMGADPVAAVTAGSRLARDTAAPPSGPGAPPPGCGELDRESRSAAGDRQLPVLPGSSMADRLQQLRTAMARLQAELERIREVLEP